MRNRDSDEGLTAQDHESRESRPTDVILVAVALLVVFTMVVLICSGAPWFVRMGMN